MSYVDAVLQPGEQVRAIGRLHWVIFLRAIALGVAGLVVLAFAQELDSRTREVADFVGGIVLAVGLLAFLQASLSRSITELAVTNRRVIYKRGFLRRHTVEMNMDKVETVDVDQSVAGRLLGYGSIRVLGTGRGIENLRRVSAPLQLRNAITAR
jgi:uncharacterized membrane protein YdbT with pleckstrin-like domain